MNTPLDYQIVTEAIEGMGLGDFSQATIRDLQSLSRMLEEKTGQQVIHLEMGVPGLQPSEIALKAEQQGLCHDLSTQWGHTTHQGGCFEIREGVYRRGYRPTLLHPHYRFDARHVRHFHRVAPCHA